MQIQIFYNGLNDQTRTIVDTTAWGSLMSKTTKEAYSMLEDMATNSYQWPNELSLAKKVSGIHEVNPITAFSAQVSKIIRVRLLL